MGYTAQDRMALQRGINATHLLSISDISEVMYLSRANKHPPEPQPVHPSALWQAMQKYLLPYHLTTEQPLLSYVYFVFRTLIQEKNKKL